MPIGVLRAQYDIILDEADTYDDHLLSTFGLFLA